MGRRAYSIAIELTAHCNQKCSYCYNAWREDDGKAVGAPKKDVLLQRVTKLVDALRPDHVTLTGGEPFANHDVWDVMELMKARGIRMQIISNGGLITDRIAGRIAPFAPSYVQVTFDGPTAEMHDEHVGGAGHFQKTIAGIAAMKRNGVTVGGCIVMTRKNAAHVGEILALFDSLGVRQIALSRFSPAGYAARNVAELLPSVADAHVALEQALEWAKKGFHIVCTMPMPPCAIEVERFAPIEFGACAIGTEMQEIALGPDGRLRNCTLHGSAILDADVLDISDLETLFDAPGVSEYKKTTPEFCKGCLHEKTCAGGCGAAAQWVLGDRSMPDPFVWQHIDEAFAARLEKLRAPNPDAKRRLEIVT